MSLQAARAKRMTLATFAVSAALGFSAPEELAKTKIVDATIFKNGMAVAVHQATIPSGGTLLIKEPPMAATGTLWIYAEGTQSISSVVMTTSTSENETTVSPGSVGEALSYNIGKTMDIRWYDNEKWRDLRGKVLAVNNQLAVIEDEGSKTHLFVQLSTIGSFKGGDDLVWTKVVKSSVATPVLRITGRAGTTVNIMGLQSGLTWVPAYQIDLSDPKKLRMTCKATVVNDLGDLDGIPARLVTGFPNFTTVGGFDPLTFTAALMRSGTGGGGGGFGGAAAPSQNAASFRREASDGYQAFEPQTGEGFSGEDLFFTPLNSLRLKGGERGYYVLFQTESPYRHLYTLDLPSSTAQEGMREYRSDELTVWHEIEFENTMKQPWTTGSGLVMQAGQMLGMDEVKYTTPGTKAYVKIAKGLDVAAETREEEVDRERGVLKDRYGNISHDRVTVKGVLEITNYKGIDVEMKISKQIEGEVLKAEGSANLFKSAARLNQVNPTTLIEWRPTVKKGAKMTFEYTYQVYIPAR